MASDEHESFVRWQGITRNHFSSVSNLVLGLATGLIAFLVPSLAGEQVTGRCSLVLSTLSLGLLVLSVALALWCAINRLRDFRATARVTRKRSQGEQVAPEERRETKILGEASWRLFWWQLVLFGFGAAGAAASVVARVW